MDFTDLTPQRIRDLANPPVEFQGVGRALVKNAPTPNADISTTAATDIRSAASSTLR